jgi:TRAP-type mannitol/chloroaromatic compound transport system permease small subunit
MMGDTMLQFSRGIDAVTAFFGYHVRWLVLAAVLVSSVNAIIRKAFDSSSNAWLEMQALLFGAVFFHVDASLPYHAVAVGSHST